jgi:hypothetical protein
MGRQPTRRVAAKTTRSKRLRSVTKRVRAESSGTAQEEYIQALDRNTRALNEHTRALGEHSVALTGGGLEECVLAALNLHREHLNMKFKKIWPHSIVGPFERIFAACNGRCFSLTAAQAETLRNSGIDTLDKVIAFVRGQA